MRSEFLASKHSEQRLLSRIGENRSFAGVSDVYFDQHAWLSGRVACLHLNGSEQGSISFAEAVRYLSVVSKLAVVASDLYSDTISCLTRSCKVTNVNASSELSNQDGFLVKAKFFPSSVNLLNSVVTVNTRCESTNGQLLIAATFELQITKEEGQTFLADSYIMNMQNLFDSEEGNVTLENEPALIYDNENISSVRLSNAMGAAEIALGLGGMQAHCLYNLRCYPLAFICAGMTTLASRLAAGRRGKRYYKYNVKYAEVTNCSHDAFAENLQLEVIHLERVNDMDILQCHALQESDPILQMELGLRVFPA